MSVVLARVDDRLVHGQVVVGWAPQVRAESLVVVDEELASDPWERELVESAVPDGLAVAVLSPGEELQAALGAGARGRTILLVRSPAGMADLVRGGLEIESVNLGGLHYRKGARRFLDFLYLDETDVEALRELDGRGIALRAQDLPGNAAVDVNTALAEGRLELDQLPPGDP